MSTIKILPVQAYKFDGKLFETEEQALKCCALQHLETLFKEVEKLRVYLVKIRTSHADPEYFCSEDTREKLLRETRSLHESTKWATRTLQEYEELLRFEGTL